MNEHLTDLVQRTGTRTSHGAAEPMVHRADATKADRHKMLCIHEYAGHTGLCVASKRTVGDLIKDDDEQAEEDAVKEKLDLRLAAQRLTGNVGGILKPGTTDAAAVLVNAGDLRRVLRAVWNRETLTTQEHT